MLYYSAWINGKTTLLRWHILTWLESGPISDKVKHHGSIHCPSFQLGATCLFVGHIYNLLVFIFLDVSIWTHISIDMTPCKLTEKITPNHVMCTIGWIHNGSKDVFWFKHFTPSHWKSIVFACIRPSLHLSVCLSVRITMFSARYNWKYVSNVFESLLEYFCSEVRGEFVVYLNIIEVLKCELQKWRYLPFRVTQQVKLGCNIFSNDLTTHIWFKTCIIWPPILYNTPSL